LLALRDRFRWLLSPPGRPGEALGVPASGEDVRSEVESLLGGLDRATADARAIVAAAEEEAERRRATGRERARVLVEQARREAVPTRTRAVAAARAEGERRAAAERAAAAREVRRIEAVCELRVGELAEEVVACVRRGGR